MAINPASTITVTTYGTIWISEPGRRPTTGKSTPSIWICSAIDRPLWRRGLDDDVAAETLQTGTHMADRT